MDDHRGRADDTPAARAHAKGSSEPGHKDPFIQLLFFRASRAAGGAEGAPIAIERRTGAYGPLRHSTAEAGERYELPGLAGSTVRIDSPATEVMTDLRRVTPVTIAPATSVIDTHHEMITRGVRSLFVVDDAPAILGIVTATDISGERPVQVAYSRGIRYSDVPVRDIMTPAERLEVLDLVDVAGARVGDVIATLKLAGRQHALVVEPVDPERPGARTVRGIFSLTHIARQLGIPPENAQGIARTFAEIESAIGG